jgi:hypothetical protein
VKKWQVRRINLVIEAGKEGKSNPLREEVVEESAMGMVEV